MAKGKGMDWQLLFLLILAAVIVEAAVKPVTGFIKVKLLSAATGGENA